MVERRDKELEAIATVISALQPLDEAVRARVLEYVLDRLNMDTVRPGEPAKTNPEVRNAVRDEERG